MGLKHAEFLKTPIQNYHQMQQIFSFRLATGKLALDSPMSEYPETRKTDTINLDGPNKDGDRISMLDRKRKRGALMEDELTVFTGMTCAVKEVASAIRESKPVNVHLDLYNAVMDQGGFSPEALMAALSHLLDNKAQDVGFVDMGDTHRVLWLRTWLGKHDY